MQEQIKLVEQERDALRTVAKNEEVARIAAEGRLPLPTSQEEDEFASPKKSRRSLDLITRSAASEEELDDIKMQLEWQTQNSKRAHDQIEFLEMQCKLNCCAGKSTYGSEHSEEREIKKAKTEAASTVFIPSEGIFRAVSPEPVESPSTTPRQSPSQRPRTPDVIENRERESISYARTPSCEPPTAALIPDINTSLLSLIDGPHTPTSAKGEEIAAQESPVATFHTISTTTRIPLADCVDSTPRAAPLDNQNTPIASTLTREQKLAQIAERRGRARSLAQGTLTPRKQMVEGGVRRDISAPATNAGKVRGRSQARS
jgi:hypothetical protein